MLVWARETAGYSIEDAARKISVSPEKLAACEVGKGEITFNQLKDAANVYKRPLALFYLSAPPARGEPVADFRLAPELSGQALPPAINIAIRQAKQRRDEAVLLSKDLEKKIPRLTERANLTEDVENVGRRMSQILGITESQRACWRSQEAALKARKSAVENLGVLVFEASHLPTEQMRGAAIPFPELPVVLLNGADAPAGKSFTLFHELCHLLLRQSGVCDLAPSAENTQRAITERFCNSVAAACLMPASELLPQLRSKNNNDWTLDALGEIAMPLRVSREALLIRLISLGYATYDDYQNLKPRMREEYLKFKELQKAKTTGRGGPSPAVMAVRNLGKPYVNLVLEAYGDDRIGLSTASDYLGVKVRHLARIRDLASQTGAEE